MLKGFLWAILCMFTLQNISFASLGENDAAGETRQILTQSTFIDGACIAPQFGYEKPPSKISCAAFHDAIKSGAITPGDAMYTVIATAGGCGNDPAQWGSNTNTLDANAFLSKRIKIPTFLELRVKIYHNVVAFLSQNAKSNSGTCSNIINSENCTIGTYTMPGGEAVTASHLYDYIVFSTLYGYITRDILNENKLEQMRQAFAQEYTINTSEPFQQKIEAIFAQSPLVGNTLVGKQTNSIEYKGTTTPIATFAERLSGDIAKEMTTDPLFFQKLGYSSLGRFPLTARLAECIEGTFNNLFLRDLPHIPMTPHSIVQNYFKPLVILVIILYIIVKGYTIFMALGVKDKSQVIMFFLEIALVSYFAIGTAWQDLFYNLLKSVPTTIGHIMLDALPSSADGCTVFKPNMYPVGKGNIAIFDTVDCKILNYYGLPQNAFLPGIFWVIVIPLLLPIPFIGTVISAIAMFYMMQVAITVLIGIQMYITAVMSFAMLIFLAPLIVPMALFNFTESIFKKWMEKIVGTLIQQSMAVLAIAVCFIVLDTFIYGTNADKKLFEQVEQVEGQTPRQNPIKKDCYGGSWYKFGFGSGSGALLGVTPIACVLDKLGREGVEWLGVPLPNFLWFFSLPFNFRLDRIIAFIVPAIIAIFSMSLASQIIQPIQQLVEGVSGMSSAQMFKGKDLGGTVKDTWGKLKKENKERGEAYEKSKAEEKDKEKEKDGKDGEK